MLKNKLYESVKGYLDQYLFGFDPSQIDVSILKGNNTHKYTISRKHQSE